MNSEPPTALIDELHNQFSTPSPTALHKSLHSSDVLFFIRNTPEYTIKSCLFPVRINVEET